MKQINWNFLILVLSAFLISGCATNQPKGPKIVPLNLGDTKVFKYLKTDADGNQITKNQIVSELVKEMYEASGYRRVFKTYSGTGKLYYVKGVEVSQEPAKLNFAYVKGDYSGHDSSYSLNKSIASFPYSVEETEGYFTIKLMPANTIVTERLNIFGLITDAPQLLNDSVMVQNLAKIYNEVNPELSYTKNVKGELNVDYNDESVFANFKRLMGDYKYSQEDKKKFDIEKDSVFSLEHNQIKLPLKVSVFPYRNGSKVMYEFDLPYKLASDGSSSFDNGSVNQLVAMIEKVAKD